mmetsp:Transcript_36515/g.102013  ORF Transcript_36515/g.102013 Transcript_36515/m.102013 type:complete len:246 (+) Transcript_36515:73-810(+)
MRRRPQKQLSTTSLCSPFEDPPKSGRASGVLSESRRRERAAPHNPAAARSKRCGVTKPWLRLTPPLRASGRPRWLPRPLQRRRRRQRRGCRRPAASGPRRPPLRPPSGPNATARPSRSRPGRDLFCLRRARRSSLRHRSRGQRPPCHCGLPPSGGRGPRPGRKALPAPLERAPRAPPLAPAAHRRGRAPVPSRRRPSPWPRAWRSCRSRAGPPWTAGAWACGSGAAARGSPRRSTSRSQRGSWSS